MTLSEEQECRNLLEKGIHELELVYNLTSIRKPLEMVKQHLLDSLSVVDAFKEKHNILDVGSGGGLPGIVLAIIYPNSQITLIDTVNKKTAFLKQVKNELELLNVTVYTGRVEHLSTQTQYEIITSRAFSELANFVNWSGHLLLKEGQMIALKGQYPEQEIMNLPIGWKVKKTEEITFPMLNAKRHLIWLIRN